MSKMLYLRKFTTYITTLGKTDIMVMLLKIETK